MTNKIIGKCVNKFQRNRLFIRKRSKEIRNFEKNKEDQKKPRPYLLYKNKDYEFTRQICIIKKALY